MHLLLIEDDSEVARLIRLELGFVEWSVDHVRDGKAGLARALSHTYDAVVLDRMLPDIDGLDLCKTLRQASSVPILMLTARGSLQDRVEGLNAGADDYLAKPFAPEELIARLRALGRRATALPSTETLTYEAFGIRLDTRTHDASRFGRPIPLTKREFDLLALFLKNPGTVLTRDMILEQVWGWNYIGSSNIVDVYVGYLRGKLVVDAHTAPIQTVRGFGYVLREDEA